MIHDSERGIRVVFPQLSLIGCFLSLSSLRATRKDHALHLNTFQESWGYQKGTRTKSGQSASLMRDSPTVFLCYIRTRCQLQTKRCRVHLEAARGSRSHTRFDWHVLTSPNEPNFKADSHAVNQGRTACTSFLPFPSIPISSPLSPVSLPVCLGPPPPTRLPRHQCPLSRQETCKPRPSTQPRCVLPGVPPALSLSMESTRDIRWAVPFCQVVHSSGQR